MTNIIIPIIFLFTDLIFHQILGQGLISTLSVYFVFQCFQSNKNWSPYTSALFILIQDFIATGQVGLILLPIIFTIFISQILRNSFKGNITIPAQFLVLSLFIASESLLKNAFLGQNMPVQSTLYKILINLILISLILLGTWGSRFLAMSKRGKSGLQTGRMPYKV